MNFNTTPTRKELSEAMAELPAEILPELANFLEYLRFKVNASVGEPIASPQTVEKGDNFLLSIAGLGESEEIDLSERDEEILNAEINPNRGFSHTHIEEE